MRGLQGNPSKTPVVRFGALSVWMVLVALPEFEASINVLSKETRI